MILMGFHSCGSRKKGGLIIEFVYFGFQTNGLPFLISVFSISTSF